MGRSGNVNRNPQAGRFFAMVGKNSIGGAEKFTQPGCFPRTDPAGIAAAAQGVIRAVAMCWGCFRDGPPCPVRTVAQVGDGRTGPRTTRMGGAGHPGKGRARMMSPDAALAAYFISLALMTGPAAPKSICPAWRARNSAMTRPMSRIDSAPRSAMALSMAAAASASSSWRGR